VKFFTKTPGVPTVQTTATTYSSIAGAVTGLVLWTLSTYVFRHQAVPGAVEAAAWVLIPALVAGLAARFTRTRAAEPVPAPPVKL
jgi:hypothetical protein